MARKKKILIVDQDLLACRAYKKLLEKAGFVVNCCIGGEEALKTADSSYSCILIDTSDLPKLDGWEVVRRLKGDDHTKDTPVVIFTSTTGDHYFEKSKQMGADGFVDKFQPAQVVEEIKNILRGGGSTR